MITFEASFERRSTFRGQIYLCPAGRACNVVCDAGGALWESLGCHLPSLADCREISSACASSSPENLYLPIWKRRNNLHECRTALFRERLGVTL